MPASIKSRTLRFALVGPSAVVVLVATLLAAPVALAGQPGDITLASAPDQRVMKLGDIASDDDLLAVVYQERNLSYMRWSTNAGSTFAPKVALRSGLRAKDPRVAVCDDSIFSVSIWQSDVTRNVGVDYRNLVTGDKGRFSLGAGAQVDIACYGEVLAVTWVHEDHLWLAVHEGACANPCSPTVKLDLGPADFDSPPRISGDYGGFVVTWINDGLAVQHFEYEAGGAGGFNINPGPVTTLMAGKDVRLPVIAALGQRTVVAYERAGQTHLRVSDDVGSTFGPRIIVSNYCKNCREGGSEPESVAVSGSNILVEVARFGGTPGGHDVIAFLTRNGGNKWVKKSTHSGGFRRGVLLSGSLYAEAWDFHVYNGSPYPRAQQLIGFHVRSLI